MRYYSIVLTDAGGQLWQPPSLSGVVPGASYASYVNGQTLSGALNVELDVSVSVFSNPIAEAYVRVWGVDLADIGQSADLRGKNIKVYAGMKKGLPLAREEQSGLILQGFVNKSFGNWRGTDQTLDLIVAAGESPDGVGSADKPKNIVHNWKKGTLLSTALSDALTTAFPGYVVSSSISTKLVLQEDDVGVYQTPYQYAQYIDAISRRIVGGTYQGVKLRLQEKTFVAYDDTSEASPKTIDFQDLIGQPTWIDTLTVQTTMVMRADISVGDYISLPKTLAIVTNEGAIPLGTAARSSSIFQGTFRVSSVRHVGNFRQPDGDSWCTIVNASQPKVQ